MQRATLLLMTLLLGTFLSGEAQIPRLAGKPTPGDARLADYFRFETAALSQRCLADIRTLDEWKAKRGEYRRQLQEMLGLWPMPELTDLQPVVTGRLTNDGFTVEKIYFQASPDLYCTASLYLPKNLTNRAPAILYECGHVRAVTNGMSLGNKAIYQSDGAWYARNGYVCLVLDTLLAGEIEGIHTGTRNHGLWWWNSRGYTPGGVEAWFGIRALDYLCTRPEVDTNRFGITGHSGGGAYSWTITALDDRIKAAAPLAGMADVQSHLLDGVIDGHCDCNFFINIYRWDFPQVAALAAPRPLLIGGTDQDPLFPLSSTLRIYEQVRRIYGLYGASNQLGLAVAPGLHSETPELQLATLRWFNRQLKGAERPVETAAKKFFPPESLRVFDTLPTNSINTNIADTFVPLAKPEKKSAAELRAALREKVFAGWPDEGAPLEPIRAFAVERAGLRFSAWDFTSQHDVSLRLYLLESAAVKPAEQVEISVLDPTGWTNWLATMNTEFGGALTEELASGDVLASHSAVFEAWQRELLDQRVALGFLAPRGVGLTAWSGGDDRLTKIRRRFMLLGQTLDGMRVWDIRRAVQVLSALPGLGAAKIKLHAEGSMGVNALYAALFETGVRKLDLEDLPQSQMEGPDYLGVLKVTDIPQVTEVEAAALN
ncbi:MAG: acetylxylan esterase [Verrucomicrobiia bacterium]